MRHKITVMLALLLAMLVAMTSYATTIVVRPNNPCVEVSADGTTLTFYNQVQGADYKIEDEYSDAPAWCSTKVTKVVFDPSFIYITPSSTANWFKGCTNLKTIEGIEYLVGDSVKNTSYMFYDCKSLTTLDLAGWNTYKLTDCRDMFAGCTKLKTIYANTWNIVPNMTTEEQQKFLIWQMMHSEENYMFDGCTSLVGGSGTKYDSNIKNKDYTYCHVDGGTSNPGFFTRKPAVKAPYAVLKYGILTLYYDDLRYERIGNKYDLAFGEDPAYSGNNTIKEVEIDNSMSGLTPTSTFRLFYNLQELCAIRHLENLNTSSVTDMSYMFANCCSLGAIDMSGLKTQNVTNMEGMFSHCFSLSYLNLSGLNTQNVENMSFMFNRCLLLKNVDLNGFNTSRVTDMSGMFNECLSLQTLNLSNFNTSRVTTMQSMFNECRNLRILNISSFNTANVTNMSYMFSKCNNLTTIDLRNFNTTKVTNMMYMFGQQKWEIVTQLTPAPSWYHFYTDTKKKVNFPSMQLQRVDISSFNTANVTNMGSMFEYQPALTTIFVGNSWSTAKVTSSRNMFKDSEELVGGSGTVYDANHIDHLYAHVDGGASNPGYLTLTGNQGGTGVKEAYAVVSGTTLTFYYDELKQRRTGTKYDLTAVFTGSNLPGWHAYATTLTRAVINPSMKDYRPTSTACWFYELSELTSIDGLQNLNTSAVSNMSFMFQKCGKLTSIDVSSFNTASVTNMRAMFAYCPSLTTLDLRSFNTSKVANMRSMFNGDTALKSIDLSSFNTANVENFSFMFYDCSALQALDIIHFNTAKATTMRQMFRNCSTLKALELRNFNTTNVTDMYAMFYDCSSLTHLDVSTFSTEKVTTMRAMFYKCEKLTTIDVSGFNTANVTDMGYLFTWCSSLKELCLSGFNTANDTTTEAMFSMCNALKTIYVKENWNTSKVVNDRNMFNACLSLVGGMGTAYNRNNILRTYARIDGGASAPGYFTSLSSTIPSGVQAYAMYADKTLTFYYDNKANSRTGTKYLVGTGYSSTNLPRWIMDYYRRTFTKAVFDSSFASYRPTSTAFWFYNCSAMTTIEGISNLNTSNVTSMAEMFRYCSVLNNLDLRSFDTSNVTDMSCMFCYCWKLSNVDVSSFNTSKVTNMSHLFHQCPIASVNVSNFNTGNVTDMSIMFAECKNLKALNLKNFNTAKVTNMAWMFIGDRNLTTIYASDKWTTSNVSDGTNMFYGDTQLVGGRGTKYTTEHTDQEYACIDGGGCEPGYLTGDTDFGPLEAYVNIVDTVMTFYYDDMRSCRQGETYMVGQKKNMSLNGYNVPNWYHASINVNSVVNVVFDRSFINYHPTSTACWFSDMTNLRYVIDLYNLNTSETTEMGSMFSNCMNLEYLDLSDMNTPKVTTMEAMFWSCTSLQVLNGLDRWNTSNVTDMNHMFSGCLKLRNMNLSAFDTHNVTCMNGMFKNCQSLEYLNISKFNTAKVTSMYNMFAGCTSLPKLDVSSFNTGNVTEAYGMFKDCWKLAELDVSRFNTSNMKLIMEMFEDCYCLKTLDLSNFDTRNVESLGAMFAGCHELQTIYVSDAWTTDKVTSGLYVFNFCNNLVGGAGTTFSWSHTDYAYAHVDGGPSNPGYFTYKANRLKGDVNADGEVGIGDIVAVTNVMADTEDDAATIQRADVNGDGEVGIGDIVAITNIMAGNAD